MQIHGPDPGFVRPIEMPPPAFVVPTVQSAVAVTPTQETQARDNNVAFQDPNRDGRRSLYQELGGKYVGFFRTSDLNLHRPVTIELDFGANAGHVEYIITMEAFLDTGITGSHHGLGLTANVLADDSGHVVATYPPLIKILADPAAIAGFHVYAFPVAANGRVGRPEAPSPAATVAARLNLRPSGRFDGQA